MNMPGFTADTSVYQTSRPYQTISFDDPGNGRLAAITVASPIFNPCSRYNRLYGCAKARCFCICNDGIPHSQPSRPLRIFMHLIAGLML